MVSIEFDPEVLGIQEGNPVAVTQAVVLAALGYAIDHFDDFQLAQLEVTGLPVKGHPSQLLDPIRDLFMRMSRPQLMCFYQALKVG